MTVDEAGETRLAGIFTAMRPVLDERQWRRLLGAEARHGRIAAVARASGCAESTVTAGAPELAGEAEPLPVGFQNSADTPDLAFYATRSYSLLGKVRYG
jgi:hypothetical protein